MVAEHDADEYERTRKRQARRAFLRAELNAREFERECHEAEKEACNMRAKVIAALLRLH